MATTGDQYRPVQPAQQPAQRPPQQQPAQQQPGVRPPQQQPGVRPPQQPAQQQPGVRPPQQPGVRPPQQPGQVRPPQQPGQVRPAGAPPQRQVPVAQPLPPPLEPPARIAPPGHAVAPPPPRQTDTAVLDRVPSDQRVQPTDLDLNAALAELVRLGGSDLHLSKGSPPMMRLSGELRPAEGYEPLDSQIIQRVMYAILTQKQREKFEENLELDLAYAVPNAARFRVNVYKQRESVGAAFRIIPYEIKPLEALGIPQSVSAMAGMARGMVLVTGPTGSGKSTTLASLVDLANRTRHDHIMTVEDPIEFLHEHKGCLVNQREVGEDTWSFSNALKHVLRQDPDIILVGEMRDLETISVALTAAETGHLVFATLHTQDAAQTIDRVIDVFPPHQQQQVRAQLAGAIQGVVCQTLCRTADGRGRAAAVEVMYATPAIRNLIREGKTHQIYSSMQAGAAHGMQTMDQHLAMLVKSGKITYEHGMEKCHHVEDFQRLCGRG